MQSYFVSFVGLRVPVTFLRRAIRGASEVECSYEPAFKRDSLCVHWKQKMVHRRAQVRITNGRNRIAVPTDDDKSCGRSNESPFMAFGRGGNSIAPVFPSMFILPASHLRKKVMGTWD